MRLRAHASSAGKSGFTLIELLVSIVILSTGIVLVLEAFQTAMVALAESRETMLLDLMARERIALIDLQLAESSTSAPQSEGGRFTGRFSGYDWLQRVTSSRLGDNGSDAGRIYDVVVSVGRVGSQAGYSLRTSFFVQSEKKDGP